MSCPFLKEVWIMILCQACKKSIATVHLTEIHSGKRREKHLCEDCARKMDLPHKQPAFWTDLLGAFIEKEQGQDAEGKGRACPDCGLTFSEFKKKGRLGCAKDYQVFKKGLEGLLAKMHGSVKYVGKVPRGHGTKPIYKNELLKLKNRLKKVIKTEEYEEAARIRDRILELESLIGHNVKATREGED